MREVYPFRFIDQSEEIITNQTPRPKPDEYRLSSDQILFEERREMINYAQYRSKLRNDIQQTQFNTQLDEQATGTHLPVVPFH